MTISRQVLFTLLMLTSWTVLRATNIKGRISNQVPSKTIYLFEYFGELVFKYDSTQIAKNGSFTLGKGKNYPRGLYRIGFSKDSSANIVLGTEDLELTSTYPAFSKNLEVKNSLENQLYKEYILAAGKFSSSVEKLQKRFEQNPQLAEQDPDQYNKLVTSLRQQYDSLTRVKNKDYLEIIKKGPSTFSAKLVGTYITPDTLTQDNYFKASDFTDVELTRGDMLANKVKTYFQLFIQPQEQALAEGVNTVLLKAPQQNANREVTMISILSLFNQFQLGINRQLKTQLKAEYPNSKYVKALLPMLRQDPPDVGDVAPNFAMSDTSGKPVSLESLKGKVVLLDFWASWCGPCRMENPNVVRAYNKYKDKGFTVFSVSLDNSREKWLQALKKDGLTWTHVSELRGWDTSAGKLYHVTGIPATFLIDKNGKIIARNLRGPALDEMLDKVLTP